MGKKKINSSTILTCVGALGVIMTTAAAIRATPKALELLKSGSDRKGEELTRTEIVQIAAPAYIPTVVLGVATVMCIFGANVLNTRNQARLTSAYALLNNYHRDYRRQLIGLYGKDADLEVQTAMARKQCNYHQLGMTCPDSPATFYDEISGESITCYEREVMDAEYHLNRNFIMRGYASLNEFYEFLGMPTTKYGDEVGWSSADGYCWIDFEHRLVSRDDGGTYIYSIDMLFSPDSDYMREWE